MKLRYHLSKNFGDALNPLIFNHFLPDFFNDNNEIEFIGIGSILGFKSVQNAKKKVVFSSGFAYGSKPILNTSYDIKCVRGPLTANVLNIDSKYGVADGAILLQHMPLPNKTLIKKKYKYSFMPHWESALKYNWKELCNISGIHYINPTADYHHVIQDILASEIVIAEAMHAAIVADTLRVPWIAVKAYGGINDFKWNDWLASFNMSYEPVKIPSLYNNTTFTKKIIKEKTGYPFKKKSLSPFLAIYEKVQDTFIIDRALKIFETVKKMDPKLSKDALLKEKGEVLLEKLDEVKRDYSI